MENSIVVSATKLDAVRKPWGSKVAFLLDILKFDKIAGKITLFQIFQYGQTTVCTRLTTTKPGYNSLRTLKVHHCLSLDTIGFT